MAAACFTVFQHIDWLGDTSESWCVTLNKSTPLREECAGIWDWAETKSREQRRKQSIHLSWWQWPAGSSWQQGVVLYLLVLYTVESGISVVDGGKDADSILPDTQSTNSPRKTLTSNILSRSRMIHSSLWLPPNMLCMALLNKMAIETIS